MLFKIDENLPQEVGEMLRAAGHDASTVLEQRMGGAQDESIAEVCRREARVIITLDVGFSDVRKYPPDQHAGIVVMRLGSQHKQHVLRVFTSLLPLFETRRTAGSLWVVDEASVRIRAASAE